MSDIEVRGIKDDEIVDYLRCMGTAFLFSPTVSDEQLAHGRVHLGDLSRRLGAFVAGALCGTAGSFATQVTVPGDRTVECAAVTQVTVLPTHRRRGLLGSMMRTQLQDAIDRGEVAAMLIAAEWPIYGRFGYGMAAEAAGTELDASMAEFRQSPSDGSVELVDATTLLEHAPGVFDRHRLTSPGSITRSDLRWRELTDVEPSPWSKSPPNRMRALHRDTAGEVDGYVVYDPTEKWSHNRPRVELQVVELMGANPNAWLDLWRYLAAVDWVSEVRAGVRPVDEDLRPHLADGRATRQADRSDHMWVRLLDVRRALESRAYEVPGRTVLEVHDPYLDRGGRFELDAGPDGATCAPTDRSPDVSVDIDVLGGAYLGGGSSLRGYALAGRIEEHSFGALAALERTMRTSRAPWATTNF
jgi:predicted acetyltransferase